jgi:predicted permease
MTSTLPLTQAGIDFDLPFLAEGQPVVPEEQAMQVDYRIVSAGYLDAMGIELVNGRDFSAIDRAGSRPVVLVNEAFANEHWPGRSAIGRTVTLFYVQNRTWEVVGVVADTRHRGLSAPPRSQVFVPLAQAEVLFGYMTLVVRTAGEVPGLTDAMRDAATSIDPSEPLYEFDTIETLLADATMRDRVAALVFGAFAAIAIVLAAAGIYGVISYQVAARTREIGVRLALGSSRGRVLGSVVGEAAVLSATGIAVGLGIAIAAARTAGGFLHGISANDPATLAGVSALLLGVSLMAAFVPARRAASVPPVEALRTD